MATATASRARTALSAARLLANIGRSSTPAGIATGLAIALAYELYQRSKKDEKAASFAPIRGGLSLPSEWYVHHDCTITDPHPSRSPETFFDGFGYLQEHFGCWEKQFFANFLTIPADIPNNWQTIYSLGPATRQLPWPLYSVHKVYWRDDTGPTAWEQSSATTLPDPAIPTRYRPPVYAAIDPMRLPIKQQAAVAQPVPLRFNRLIAVYHQELTQTRAHTTERGNNPPAAIVSPIPEVGRPNTPFFTQTRTRTGFGEKEAKLHVTMFGEPIALKVFGILTESLDLIECFGKALPQKYQRRFVEDRSLMIWKHFDKINWSTVVQECMLNHLEDAAIGLQGKLLGQISKQMGIPVGLSRIMRLSGLGNSR